jgi:hypothetical protein
MMPPLIQTTQKALQNITAERHASNDTLCHNAANAALQGSGSTHKSKAGLLHAHAIAATMHTCNESQALAQTHAGRVS